MTTMRLSTLPTRILQTLMIAGAAVGLTACDELSTEVENPNVVVQEDVERPAAASALVNGVLLQSAEAIGHLSAAHGAVTDELTWRGSFDGVGALDRGILSQSDQRYTSDGYEALTIGRWLGDEAIRVLEEHRANDALTDLGFLARAYYETGHIYILAAETFEEFAISDRREPGPIVERGQLFQTGIDRLGQAVSLAQESGDPDVELAARAHMARGHWARALWQKLSGGVPADPLIDNADANALAEAVLGQVGPEWEYVYDYSPTTLQNRVAFETNSRREVVIENHIIRQDASLRQSCWPGNSACEEDGIELLDPIDGVQDPALRREAWDFFNGFIYSPNVTVSARELHLILAEAALAQGDDDGFAEHINAVRALESSLTPYDPAVHADIDPQELLVHMRRVNLLVQLQRRLLDMYRFGITAPEWGSTGEAFLSPGTVFPKSDLECDSNPQAGSC